MMSPQIWLAKLLEVVGIIADESYQREIWLMGMRSDEISSWQEVVCQFFDDYDADGFLEEHWQYSGMTQSQWDKLAGLRDALNQNLDLFSDTPAPTQVLSSPQWREISRLAKETLMAFEDIRGVPARSRPHFNSPNPCSNTG